MKVLLFTGELLSKTQILIDYPSERCPLVLLPFLFDKEDDIQFEKLLAESSVASIMSSSNSAGQKLTSTAMSLPDIIRESGYNACSRYPTSNNRKLCN